MALSNFYLGEKDKSTIFGPMLFQCKIIECLNMNSFSLELEILVLFFLNVRINNRFINKIITSFQFVCLALI